MNHVNQLNQSVLEGARHVPAARLKLLLERIIAVFIPLFFLVTLEFYPLDPLIMRAVFVGLVVALSLVSNRSWFKSRQDVLPLFDLLLLGAVGIATVYTVIQAPQLVFRMGVSPVASDLVFGLIIIAITFEAARRSMGNALVIVGLVVLLYAFVGQWAPGLLKHPGFTFDWIISFLYSTEGIYGIPLAVTLSYVLMFVLFGAFLEVSGGTQFFIKLAEAVAGRARGGPAKVAIVASSLFGTINGSPAANVVGTGVFTIPLMKKTGYPSFFAGAVEATASTGGQIMPPVMGASAFLMAQILGIPYASVALAAIIPALLYYAACFAQVDLEAAKRKLTGLSKEECPKLLETLRSGGHLLLPIGVLIWVLLIVRGSPILAAILGTVTCVAMSWVSKDTRVGLRKAIEAFEKAGKGIVGVGTSVAVASMIVGVFSMTGLGVNFASVIFAYSKGVVPLALGLTAFVALILGMGLPTTGSYLIVAATVAPALVKLGIPAIAAHLFVLYFANISNITPPVALAAFAASGLCGDNPVKVGVQALKLGLAGFIVPFMFVYNQALLGSGTVGEVLWVSVTAAIGIYALAVALEGYLTDTVPLVLRFTFFAGAIVLIHPGFTTDVIGFLLVGGSYASIAVARLLKQRKGATYKTHKGGI